MKRFEKNEEKLERKMKGSNQTEGEGAGRIEREREREREREILLTQHRRLGRYRTNRTHPGSFQSKFQSISIRSAEDRKSNF